MIALNLFGVLPKKISPHIKILAVRHHSKASETYVDVEFLLADKQKKLVSVPVNYRRTGVDAQTEDDCTNIIEAVYNCFAKENIDAWLAAAKLFWSIGNKDVTRPFFEVMKKKLGDWACQACELPQNPNWARRTQDIKEMGYTFATDTKRFCKNCGCNRTHLMLLPVSRGAETGYETWSPQLRRRILKTLGCFDAYENATRSAASLLPDHKFPEIRWDEDTRDENPDEMAEAEIKAKFQLLTNQRNQQKREVCRSCYQTGVRGQPYGINFFYEGNEKWPAEILKKGKAAEKGCVGCGWYDLAKWRAALNLKMTSPTTAKK